MIKPTQKKTPYTVNNKPPSLITRVYHLKHIYPQEALSLLNRMIPKTEKKNIIITADKKQGSLILESSKNILHNIIDKLQLIDLPSPEIQINAEIINIDRNFLHNIGINFSRYNTPSTQAITIPLFNLHDQSLLNLRINTLEKQGHVQILASPTLLVLDQHTAHIESGTEIPYQEKTRKGATTTAFKKASLSLEVKGKVLTRSTIIMHIKVHHDTPSHWFIKGEPAIKTQQLDTTISVSNNHTIVLGGIINCKNISHIDSVPILHNLPIIGPLFDDKKTEKQNNMLLLIITPHIINSRK